MKYCAGCGDLFDEYPGGGVDHCDSCELRYWNEQAEATKAGEPYAVQVGSAFGGPVCIMVSSDKDRCSCRGSGWCNTDMDSWHQCPNHYEGQQHPEYA
ncbi:MAG: hypothetical protein JSV86_05560 [Gemmatimonadota bacterium]|nr:MAG: hypothetical protein JSV86_05560 [Gemmatimonadota bacterium]